MSAERVLLWRHGRTAANADGRFQGQLDVPLDEVGQGQAKVAAEALEAVLGTAPCRIITSDLSRACDTAQVLAERLGLELTRDVRLREVHAGAWEGLLRDEIVAGWPEAHAAWLAGDDLPLGGGERRSEAGARLAEAVREHTAAQDGGTLVIVTHGGAMRAALLRLLGLPRTAWSVFGALRNAHWVVLTPRGGSWTLAEYNVGVAPGMTGEDA